MVHEDGGNKDREKEELEARIRIERYTIWTFKTSQRGISGFSCHLGLA